MRVMNMERKIVSKERNVDDFVWVMASSLLRKKLMMGTKGSRCWTSARTAKRMTAIESVVAQHGDGMQTHNC